jgi:hypothetical protein
VDDYGAPIDQYCLRQEGFIEPYCFGDYPAGRSYSPACLGSHATTSGIAGANRDANRDMPGAKLHRTAIKQDRKGVDN